MRLGGLGLGVLLASAGCSSADRDRSGKTDDVARFESVASGIHESEHLTEGLTGIWWSKSEDFFVAGLHKNQNAEPPLVGVYFGSLSDSSKRKVQWFPGSVAPSGEDLIGIRLYKDEKSKKRVYFLSQLQNAGFYYPAFYYFNLDTWMTTSIHSHINCEQIDDLEISTSGLRVRCRAPMFGSEEEDLPDLSEKPAVSKKKKSKGKEKIKVDTDDEDQDVVEVALDVDPTVTTLTNVEDEQYRDWFSDMLRSCVQIEGQSKALCYPTN